MIGLVAAKEAFEIVNYNAEETAKVEEDVISAEQTKKQGIVERTLRIFETIVSKTGLGLGVGGLVAGTAFEALATGVADTECAFTGTAGGIAVTSWVLIACGGITYAASGLFTACVEYKSEKRQTLEDEIKLQEERQTLRKINTWNATAFKAQKRKNQMFSSVSDSVEESIQDALEKDLKLRKMNLEKREESVEMKDTIPQIESPQKNLQETDSQAKLTSKISLKPPSKCERVLQLASHAFSSVFKSLLGVSVVGLASLQLNQKRLSTCGYSSSLDPIAISMLTIGILGGVAYSIGSCFSSCVHDQKIGRTNDALSNRLSDLKSIRIEKK